MKRTPPERLKPVAVLIALACGAPNLPAQTDPDLLVYEGFAYETGSRLELLNGGNGWSTPWLWRQDFSGGGTIVEGGAIIE
jgi:hypothetical protein